MNILKKLFFGGLIALTLGSCSVDEVSGPQFRPALVPVVEVMMPDTLVFGEEYTFEITYEKPSSCYVFAGFSYEQEKNERIIAPVMNVYEGQECDTVSTQETQNLDFQVRYLETYIFKFWKGRSDEGEDLFLVKEVPVKTKSNN